MAGLVGSLAMLLEWSRLGVTVDLELMPRPPGMAMKDWLTCFPAYGFLLCVPQGREADCLAPFHARGLDATVVGTIDKCRSGWCRLSGDGYSGWIPEEQLWGVYPNEEVD